MARYQEHSFTLPSTSWREGGPVLGCLLTTNWPPYNGVGLLLGLLACGGQTRRWVWHFRAGTKEEEQEGVMVDVEVVRVCCGR